jgi:hypothetical protein
MNVRYDAQLIEKLDRGDLAAIGSDATVLRGVIVLAIAYGAVECRLAVDDPDMVRYQPALTRIQTQHLNEFAAMALVAASHPLYLKVLALRTADGCDGERFQRVGRHLIKLMVTRTLGSGWTTTAREQVSPRARATDAASAANARRGTVEAPTSRREPAVQRSSAVLDGSSAAFRARCEEDAPTEGPNRPEYLYWCGCTGDVLAKASPAITEDERKALQANYRFHVVQQEISRADLQQPLSQCRRR